MRTFQQRTSISKDLCTTIKPNGSERIVTIMSKTKGVARSVLFCYQKSVQAHIVFVELLSRKEEKKILMAWSFQMDAWHGMDLSILTWCLEFEDGTCIHG